MDSDSILTFGLIGIGGYAIYKIFSDGGISKTTSAVGDIATSAGGLASNVIDTTNDLLDSSKQVASYGYAQAQKQYSAEGLLAFNPFYQGNKMIIDTVGKLFSKNPTPVTTPIMTNIGMTSSGAMFSSAKPLVANLSTKDGAVSQISGGQTTKSTIGAKAGTIFSSGASVKSVGASGKYKTTF